jgi:hypothetical protein
VHLNAHRSPSVDRRSFIVLTAVLVALGPSGVAAQPRGALMPSLDITTLHDDNVLMTARDAAADRVVRIRPALEAERPFPRGAYSGSYSIDAEHYARHRELTSAAARVQAFTRLRYTAGQRLSISADQGYVNTTAPTELNIGTALATSRIRTARLTGGAHATYRLSRRTTATGSHIVTRDRLEDGRAMRTDVSRAAIDRSVSRRKRLRIDYEHARFDSHSHSTTADAVRLGWTSALGSATQLEIRGGPRVTAGSVSADVLALVTHMRENTSIALSFEQAQTTVIGVDVPVDARSIQVQGRWTPIRSLSLATVPAVFQSRFAGRDIDVIRLTCEARYALTTSMTVEASFGDERQRGTTATAGVDTLRHRTLSIGVAHRWK